MTPKQERFVQEYLVDLNASEAAIRAGYSAKGAPVTASRLLRNVHVQRAVTAGQAERRERVHLDQNYVLLNLREVVERCMQRAPVMVRRGRKFEQLVDADGRHVWRFDGKVAVAALALLGKHLGMFVEQDAGNAEALGAFLAAIRTRALGNGHGNGRLIEYDA